MLIADYVLPTAAPDSGELLRNWRWLFPDGASIVLMNLFAEPFLESPDGGIHYLDPGSGTLERIAADRDEFHRQLLDPEKVGNWLLIPLVRKCKERGLSLEPGQCYAFRVLPVFQQGTYDPDNVFVSTPQGYLDFAGQVHKQIAELPDGAAIRIVECP